MLDNKFKLDNRFKAYLIFSSVITLFWSIMGFGEFGLILWLHFVAISFYVCCNKKLLVKIGKIDPIDIFYLFLTFFSGQILGMFLNITMGDPKYDQLQEMMANNLTFVLIVTFITAPLAEEVIFRGIILFNTKENSPCEPLKMFTGDFIFTFSWNVDSSLSDIYLCVISSIYFR